MKPRNFPARKLQRQQRAGHYISDAKIALARGVRTKKALASASPERRLARRGKM